MKYKETIQWLKSLFLDYNKPMNRKEMLNIFGFLWFINLASCSFIISNYIVTYLISSKGDIWLASYSIFSRFSFLEFSIGIPWNALLLLGCILFVFRLYAQKKFHFIIKIIFGIMVFFFYRFFLLYVMISINIEKQFSSDPTIIALLSPSVHLHIYFVGWLKFIGFSVIIFPFVHRKEKSTPYDERDRFLQISLLLSFVSYILLIVLISVYKNEFFKGITPDSLNYWLIILSIIGIVQFFYCIYHLLESNISFWYSFLIFIPLLLIGCSYLLMLKSMKLIFANIGQYIFQLSFGLCNIFYFILLLAKPKQNH